jgi:hypothetical protein
LGDLIEEYAVFVSQRLNACLDPALDVSRLLDDEQGAEQLSDTSTPAPSQSRLN